MSELYSTDKMKRGNLILTHGLNLNPAKLEQMALWYNSQGLDVYLLRYSGHKGDRSAEFSMQAAMDDLTHLVTKLKGDYYFCGFSLGCLVYARALSLGMIPEAQKNIFFSPAFRPTPLIQISSLLPYHFKIPSRIYLDYQLHRGLEALVYKDVVRQVEEVKVLPFKNSTIVFMDLGDLTLNVKKIIKLTNQYEQHIWRYRKTPAPRHVIVDEHSVGEELWPEFLEKITHFLERA